MTTPKSNQETVDAVTDALLDSHRRWIEEFAASIDRSYLGFMSDLEDCLKNGYSMSTGDNDIDVPSELWVHYEALRGPVPEERKQNFWFSCAC